MVRKNKASRIQTEKFKIVGIKIINILSLSKEIGIIWDDTSN